MLILFALVTVIGVTGLILTRKRAKAAATQAKKWQDADSFVMAAGAGGMSIFKLYMASANHAEALSQYQNVADTIIPPDASPDEWFGYFERFQNGSEAQTMGLINSWKGEMAEHEALSSLNSDPRLAEQGIEAVLNPDAQDSADIFFTGTDGQPLTDAQQSFLNDNYGGTQLNVTTSGSNDPGYILQQMQEHPDQAFVVNHESYELISSSPDYSELSHRLIDGGFSDAALTQEATESIGDILDAGDVADNIPLVGALIFGWKSKKNIAQVMNGEKSITEGGVDVAGDAVGIAGRGAAGVMGAKIGGVIGAALGGVGVIPGAIIGSIASAFAAGRLMDWLKYQFKYKDLMDACESIGWKYASRVQPTPYNTSPEWHAIADGLFSMNQLRLAVNTENNLIQINGTYIEKLSKLKPNPALALLARSYQYTEHQYRIAHAAAVGMATKLSRFLSFFSVQTGANEKQRKREIGMLGAFVAQNEETLLKGTSDYQNDVQTVVSRSRHFPNHPYALKDANGTTPDPKALLKTFAINEYDRARQITPPPSLPFDKRPDFTIRYMLFFLLSGAGILALIVALYVNIIASRAPSVAADNTTATTTARQHAGSSTIGSESRQSDISSDDSKALGQTITAPAAPVESGVPVGSATQLLSEHSWWKQGNTWVYRLDREIGHEATNIDDSAFHQFLIRRTVTKVSEIDGATTIVMHRDGGIYRSADMIYVIREGCIFRVDNHNSETKLWCADGATEQTIDILGEQRPVLRFDTIDRSVWLDPQMGIVKWTTTSNKNQLLSSTLVGVSTQSATAGDWRVNPVECTWRTIQRLSKTGEPVDPESSFASVIAENAPEIDLQNAMFVKIPILATSNIRKCFVATDGAASVFLFVTRFGAVVDARAVKGNALWIKSHYDEMAQTELIVIGVDADSEFDFYLSKLSNGDIESLTSHFTNEPEYTYDFHIMANEAMCYGRFIQQLGSDKRCADVAFDWAHQTFVKLRGSLAI